MRVILVSSMVPLKHSVSLNNKSNNNNKIVWLFFSKEIETLYQHYCLINLTSLRNSTALCGRRSQTDLLAIDLPGSRLSNESMRCWTSSMCCVASTQHAILSPDPRSLSPDLSSPSPAPAILPPSLVLQQLRFCVCVCVSN